MVGMCQHLFCVDLNKTKVDLMLVENRRFMYHPDGWLIMGSEGTCTGNRLAKSHAEEYGEAASMYALPPYDAFVRGWVGVGRAYKDGIIHFTPPVMAEHLEGFNRAFDFIEVALENGFGTNTVLRGFPGAWEQKIGDVLVVEKPLEEKLAEAKKQAAGTEGMGAEDREKEGLF